MSAYTSDEDEQRDRSARGAPMQSEYEDERQQRGGLDPGGDEPEPGRPIDAGKDFDQPTISWIAAATRMMRAASVAGRYRAPKTSSIRLGISHQKNGTSTMPSPNAIIV